MKIRKRTIALAICLGVSISQVMIFVNSKAIAQNIDYQQYSTDTYNINNLYPGIKTKTNEYNNSGNNSSYSRKTIPLSSDATDVKLYKTLENNINTKTTNININKSISSRECKNILGIKFFKDYGNRKIIIAKIIKNSPADRAGLNIGDEIIKINKQKASKLNPEILANLIDKSENPIELSIRDIYNNKTKIKINKNYVCFTREMPDEIFNTYWLQVGPDISSLPQAFFQHVSQQVKTDFTYWSAKKRGFTNGYVQCINVSNSTNDFNNCMNNLVNRYLIEIEKDKEIALQQEIMKAQMYMNAQYTNAVNNYANALRNQNVNLNQNIRHSGGINVNQNIKHDIYWNNW